MKRCLFFLLIILSCNTQDFLLSSTYQHWVGGRQETGSGTNYRFKIVAPDSHKNFQIEKIKAHKKALHHNINPETFQKGDTIMVFAYKSKDRWNSDTTCTIQYTLNKKSYTIEPQDLKELEKLYYP